MTGDPEVPTLSNDPVPQFPPDPDPSGPLPDYQEHDPVGVRVPPRDPQGGP